MYDSNTSLKFKVDTGAQANIISLNTFNYVFSFKKHDETIACPVIYILYADYISIIDRSNVKCRVLSKIYRLAVHHC